MTTAIAHALTILGWFEMQEEDRPPEQIWLDDEALSAHFDRVNERYRSKSGGKDMEAVPQHDMQQNEFTSQFRR